MERSLNRNEIGCRRLNGRSKEKYPHKQPSENKKKFFLMIKLCQDEKRKFPNALEKSSYCLTIGGSIG
jgi:hypothetical protein